MKLKYHNNWRGNFGDDLNIPFFTDNFGDKLNETDKTIYGIGTLLNNVHGKIKDALIFGSGYGYGNTLDFDPKTVEVFGVRGPRTAEKLGYTDDSIVIGDPALYVDKMERYRSLPAGKHKKVIALHHSTAELFNYFNLQHDGYYFLDPGLESIENYISVIKGADIVYTESLHGAIIAAVYGKPFVAISMITTLEDKKWLDFYQSVGIDEFKVSNIHVNKIPFLRKATISAKARRFFNPSKIGVSVSSESLEKTIADIENIDLSSYIVRADGDKVTVLKNKIATAIVELNNYLDNK
ncbi:hypothetical protein BCV00_17310 [Vibrio breoganii]|uniref:polysaccharide pyruvyl transferase family protein n=1 Tax=Vibrio breoganii TaxID=553239 RepID=UPI000C84F489|nr:polysaccharide pyruvyl transferase family protein [Vibrio breoganii]PMG02421.1 hypothetical protein BCV00_17310 [Vibrio breoganii]